MKKFIAIILSVITILSCIALCSCKNDFFVNPDEYVDIKEECKDETIIVYSKYYNKEEKLSDEDFRMTLSVTLEYDSSEIIKASDISKVLYKKKIKVKYQDLSSEDKEISTSYWNLFKIYTYDNKTYYYESVDECLGKHPTNYECLLSLYAQENILVDYTIPDEGYYIDEKYENTEITLHKSWENEPEFVQYDDYSTSSGITLGDVIKVKASDISSVKCTHTYKEVWMWSSYEDSYTHTYYLFEVETKDGNIYYDGVFNDALSSESSSSDLCLAFFSFNHVVMDYR